MKKYVGKSCIFIEFKKRKIYLIKYIPIYIGNLLIRIMISGHFNRASTWGWGWGWKVGTKLPVRVHAI